jgi:hypothetical protein
MFDLLPWISITVWYFAGRDAGPPPTSMYLRSSSPISGCPSSDKYFIGGESGNDLSAVFEEVNCSESLSLKMRSA